MKTLVKLFFKYIFLGTLMVFLAVFAYVGSWVSKRINEPMALPQAQGLTFRQFWLERMEYFEGLEKKEEVRPGTCTFVEKVFTFGDAAFAVQHALSKAVPEGSFFDRTTVKDDTYKLCAPKHKVTAEDFMESAWETFECMKWDDLGRPTGGTCHTTYVNFDVARQK